MKPKIGDLVACVDGDLGLVLEVSCDSEFMVRIIWKSGDTFFDPWLAQDFADGTELYSVTSRA